jgi:hypothetical protein
MNSLRTNLASFFLAASLCGLGWAQPVQWADDANGFSSPIPSALTLRQDASGAVATDSAQRYAIVIKSHSYANFEAFAADANLARDGFQLVGEVQTFGNGGRCFRASRGDLVADTFVSFSPYGGGSLVVALAKAQDAGEAFQQGLSIASGVRYSQPQRSQWDAALSGKHLVGLYTSSGFSERTDIYLFSTRRFVFRRDSSSLSANGSGIAAGGSEGTWRATPGGELVLQFASGQVRTYRLSERPARNEVGLNGQRYFVLSE